MLGVETVKVSRFGALAFLAFAFLFAGVWETSPGMPGFLLREMISVVEDSRTQWVVFLFLGIYFTTFLVLRTGSHFKLKPAAGLIQFFRHESACLWLSSAVSLGAISYARDYSPSTSALMLMGGAVIGQGLVAWAGYEVRHQAAAFRNRLWASTICLMMILLAFASVWKGDSAETFEYQGAARWTGLWGNPNIFGVLMATGLLLALGQIIHTLTFKRPGPTSVSAAVIACSIAALLLGRALYHSYSRGAWLGTGCGLLYLGATGAPALAAKAGRCDWRTTRAVSWVKKNQLPFLVMLSSAAIMCFWSFRQTSWHPARRAFSAVNAVDFSWRNRVSAWEGALQISAEFPWTGAGWDQPEPLYEHFYLPPRLTESLAIQMNDYLQFCATLGLPALFCFAMYLWRSLHWTAIADNYPVFSPATPASDWPPPRAFGSLQNTCRAGVLTLLVGFWFDGGLFKLPTAATFWILLEMGSMGSHHFRYLIKMGGPENNICPAGTRIPSGNGPLCQRLPMFISLRGDGFAATPAGRLVCTSIAGAGLKAHRRRRRADRVPVRRPDSPVTRHPVHFASRSNEPPRPNQEGSRNHFFNRTRMAGQN